MRPVESFRGFSLPAPRAPHGASLVEVAIVAIVLAAIITGGLALILQLTGGPS